MSKNTAKIVQFHKLGGADVLKLEELPLPEPGQGEVRLRVHAIGLNRAEIMFREGRYLAQPIFPSKLGYEAAGIVEAVGSGVDSKLIGKKFSTVPDFPVDKYGVYGEVAIVPESALAAYPEKLSAEEATSIWMQYMTAYGALVLHGKVTKGDFVLIPAASSSVGVAAIEIARAQGAIPIAVTRTAKKKEELHRLGATHVIVSDEENVANKVMEITGGKGARVVFTAALGKSFEAFVESAANEGLIFVYGALSNDPTSLPVGLLLGKSLTIRGFILPEFFSKPGLRAAGEKYIFDHLASGAFKPKIARRFTLDQIVEAHRYMESNEQIGKIVVTVG